MAFLRPLRPFIPVMGVGLGCLVGREQAEACGIVGVVGKSKDTDARGFLLEGLQVEINIWFRFSNIFGLLLPIYCC